MLTELKAYSAWQSAPTLPLSEDGRAETDLIQIRSIDGLDPVKGTVTTSPLGSVDGESYTGTSIPKRNIVLTLGINPNWDNWTFEGLRKLLYQYFMPKRPTRLVFYSDDISPVEIFGVVESVTVNQFSKDPEIQVSIICPDPYFIALDPIIVTGQSISDGGDAITVDYNGNIEAGIHLRLTQVTAPTPTIISIQIGDSKISYFTVAASVNSMLYFEMNSVSRNKYVQNVDLSTGVITNLLSHVQIAEGSSWPILEPGENEFSVITDAGVQDWELTYYERYGGL